ncbi:hypothetical protein CBO05C_3517 [Clostridium botulinum B str. Osaka05]|uniref:Uncharacterized protein n=1 Tax=Clostridium botulinum B str. Osaka05 TaxID=1407017 RepID=A0A0S6U5U1_CLOBO|nr:hypothetical protein CBO05C_3517 [Clostridium botulinum B str. Osaka05]
MFGRITKIRYLDLLKQIKTKIFIKEEKKLLSVALQIQKIYMDYAMLGFQELKTSLNNTY